MQLGLVAPGVVHTFRYFRGSQVVHTKQGHIVVEHSPHGGICFFFEIDYNKGQLLFSSAITREDDAFAKSVGRDICAERARIDSGKTFKLAYNPNEDLLEQVYQILASHEETGDLQDKPYLMTLLSKMRLYDAQNADAALLYQDMLDTGVIVIPE